MEKVVYIAGASRGIGAATTAKFVKEGWRVVGFYNQKKIEDEERVKYLQLDIANADSVEKAFSDAFKIWGRVDCLVNCAGIYGYKTLAQYDWETMEKVIGVNEVGSYLVIKRVIRDMNKGAIVMVSSTAAQIGSSDPVYAGTKAAVLGLVKSMAKALAPDIRVNCVAPGVTESDMTKSMNQERLDQLIEMSLLKKIARPEEVAEAIYFLAGDAAGHVTGACLDINGGYVLR